MCAVLAAASVLVWRPPWACVRVRVAGVQDLRFGPRARALCLAMALLASLVSMPPAPTIVAWTGVAVGLTAWHRVRRSAQRRERNRVRGRAQDVLDALVAELRSGAAADRVISRLADEFDEVAPVAATAATGGDVATAFIAAGDRPGADAFTAVGHAWAVSQSCGAPLVPVLEQVRRAVREDREIDHEIAAEVAPARATATMMAAMPPLGLGLGSGLGVDPLAVVLTTVPGALCVAVGVGFAIAGVLWIDHIADRAESAA